MENEKVYVVVYLDDSDSGSGLFSDVEVFTNKEKANSAFMTFTGIPWDWDATFEENEERLSAHNESIGKSRIVERFIIQ